MGNNYKNLKDISWQVDEPTYRQDAALSYSTLSRYEREGFSSIPHLFEKVEAPALTFGSMVDVLLTSGGKNNGEKAFHEQFLVAVFPEISDALKQLATRCFGLFDKPSLRSIPTKDLVSVLDEFSYCKTMQELTRLNRLYAADEYYKLLFLSKDKKIVTPELAAQAFACRDAILTSEATGKYFADDSPYEPSIRRFCQLKFKGSYGDIPMRCMPDLLYVNYTTKTIIPIDLKTSGEPEYDFYKSFVHWNYNIQARSYWYIIRQNLDADEYFKDFTLEDYKFIVVNKESLNPLVYSYTGTTAVGDIIYGNKHPVIMRDWRTILTELTGYIQKSAVVPNYIEHPTGDNELSVILNDKY